MDLKPTHCLSLTLLLTACSAPPAREGAFDPGRATLTRVATSQRQWTGLALAGEARAPRVFVNYPLWSESQPFAVGELGAGGQVVPYPSEGWNGWHPGADPRERFVCVQALLADGAGRLWVLDPASPRFEGVVAGGAKLVVIDLATDRVERVYRFAEPAITPASYLNDLRLDLEHGAAYLTDSGDGALVVLDLESGQARRLLDDHPSTGAEAIGITIEGQPWLRDGATPQVHSDGIAFDAGAGLLYWQALTGRTLYRIPTAVLRDPASSGAVLGAAVERVTEVGVSDGLVFGPDGAVYLTSLEHDAIRRVWPDTGQVETVLADPRIAWPDSFALAPDGSLWFTTAQIHRGPDPAEPYGLWRVD